MPGRMLGDRLCEGIRSMRISAKADYAVRAVAVDAGLQDYFVYHERMGNGDVPVYVTHVRIDSSVRAIRDMAFNRRS